ncbi:brain-specific angiogenesis inhibitor 1-associated protein 2-like protein 2 [Marmota marmota marmota]|uniref:brain-specific angiogenesis inhibitor 1-associated protein 2-like protein 2 n=1 Tax=Marmota marmota marmota TaxID=9994 RepID=UPI0020927ED6|nr:brain-specific angiogenesis inhibitor 1-associated protein 2-like protein 2 [Marmota marmota marmota]
MAPEMDQFYRSTMAIYKSIMEQFNPALENLVYLGNNYLRAFHALSEAAEVYFRAIQKIGEQALQSSTSQILGEILVQMSDTQRHLNSDLEVVVQTFHGDLLQHMEKNTKLDMQFIKDSRQHYEMEYRHRASNLEKCMSELWRMERNRDKNAREMKESVSRLHAQMQAFVTESQRAAELEEKRRYRFLAEKHLLLSNTFLQFFGRARGMLQSRVLLWKEQSEASRSPSRAHSPGLLGPALGPPYPAGRLTPTRLDMAEALGAPAHPSRPAASRRGPWSLRPPRLPPFAAPLGPRFRPARQAEASQWLCLCLEASRGRDAVIGSWGHFPGVLKSDQAENCHRVPPASRPSWSRGAPRSGWFPEAYVKPLEQVPGSPLSPASPVTSLNPANELPSRSYPLRGTHSLDDLLDRPGNPAVSSEYWDGRSRPRTPSGAPSRVPSPAPAPLPGSRRSSMGGVNDVKKLMSWEQHPPELFPRGTNPFATVKLRPTVTNDRSAPIIR